jgi:asparagine synthase (glutamine-hydrolysing)
MCGITGCFEPDAARARQDLEAIATRMASTIAHRGPDDSGVWVDERAGIALGHRRLSIIDLSPMGHQPMTSGSGRFLIAFNGEIYNYRELRQSLESEADRPAFRGSSDTEVMLAGFDRWGIEAAVRKFNGMFAFAVWDRREKALTLVRDRTGEKPLYYGWMGRSFIFGSELKALRAHPDFRGEIDRNSTALFLRHGYVPAPYSIYKGIAKLPAASILTINANKTSYGPVPYWHLKQVVEEGTRNCLQLTDDDAADQLDSLLSDAIGRRMIADVPLGAFLSGGIDSSTVVALMQKQSARPVRTFTIGFREPGYNEAEDARAVSAHLGCDHTELYVTASEAMAVIPRLPSLYDEPFADSSQIPTHLVSHLARAHVTVSLSGDGGDEVFGGYTRYLWASSVWRGIGWAPRNARAWLSAVYLRVPASVSESIFTAAGPFLPGAAKQSRPTEKLQKLAEILPAHDRESLYRELVSQWRNPTAVVVGASELPTLLTEREGWPDLGSFVERMMYLDTATYLADDILVKLDRASMGVALESRVPLLDHRVIEFAWQLPLAMKVRGGVTKWLLRRVLSKYVPSELVDRPKSGFAIPVHEWLRGPLRGWAEELLDAGRLTREGFLDPGPIRAKWAEHLSRKRNWVHSLWNVLMFQSWLEESTGVKESDAKAVPPICV